jgi:alpha-glucosidase
LSVARQEEDAGSVLAFTRALLHWRREHPALVTGSLRILYVDGNLLVFTREGSGQALLCAFNLSRNAREYRLPEGVTGTLAGPPAGASLADGVLALAPSGAGVVALSISNANTGG